MRLDFLTVEIKSRVTVLDTPIFDNQRFTVYQFVHMANALDRLGHSARN